MSYCKYNFRGTNVNNATQSCKKTNKQSENSENCELSSKSGRCNLTAKIKKEFNSLKYHARRPGGTNSLKGFSGATALPAAPVQPIATAAKPAAKPVGPVKKVLKQKKAFKSSSSSSNNKSNLVNAVPINFRDMKQMSADDKLVLDDWNNFLKSVQNFNSRSGVNKLQILRGETKNENVLDYSAKEYASPPSKRAKKPLKYPNAKSILTLDKYLNDVDDFKKKQFIRLKTCHSTCSNKGYFCKEEIDFMLKTDNLKCPFCNSDFKLSSRKTEPPFGTMEIYEYNKDWYSIQFRLVPSKDDKKAKSEYRNAYYPKCDEGILCLWLLKKAWEKGKLFKMGISAMYQIYGIVFAGVHMRTSTTGGIENHGYSKNPMDDITKVLINLISECNAIDIFSPDQIISFNQTKQIAKLAPAALEKMEKAKKLVGRTILKQQTSLSLLRQKHKKHLINLPINSHRLVYAYPQALLMRVIFRPKETFSRLARQLLKHRETVLPLEPNQDRRTFRIQLQKDITALDPQLYGKKLYPEYIVNLTKVINTFPKPSKPFYVYRGVQLPTHSNGELVVQPMPFSASLNQWLAISFAELTLNANCCLYRLKVTPQMNCVILGDTPFQSTDIIKDVNLDKFDYKLWNTDKKATDLSKYNQFEVLFPPGVLKVTNVKKNMYKPNSNLQDKYKNANNVDTLKNYKFPKDGITLVDVEYYPLNVSAITPEDLLLKWL